MSKLFATILLTFSAAGAIAQQAAWSSDSAAAPLTRAEVRAEVANDTDEVRAQAAKRTATINREAALRPLVASDPEVISVTDTESARRAAVQATARRAHAQYLADVLRAGAGVRPAPIRVTDTDSARAAAAQEHREQRLLADYADYVAMQRRPAAK